MKKKRLFWARHGALLARIALPQPLEQPFHSPSGTSKGGGRQPDVTEDFRIQRVDHTPLGRFSKKDANTERYVFGKLSTRRFQTPTFLAPTRSQLWRYRPGKISQGVCSVHRLLYGTVIYGTIFAARSSPLPGWECVSTLRV